MVRLNGNVMLAAANIAKQSKTRYVDVHFAQSEKEASVFSTNGYVAMLIRQPAEPEESTIAECAVNAGELAKLLRHNGSKPLSISTDNGQVAFTTSLGDQFKLENTEACKPDIQSAIQGATEMAKFVVSIDSLKLAVDAIAKAIQDPLAEVTLSIAIKGPILPDNTIRVYSENRTRPKKLCFLYAKEGNTAVEAVVLGSKNQ